MNLNNIVTLIKNVGLNYPTIQEFGEGDIYEFLNSKEHKYPCIFLTIESISTDGDVQNINATLFYVDRLLDDNSNKLDIQSVSVTALKSIIEKLEETNYINFTSINYTPFTEKFTDLCAGSFAQCTIQVNDILECDDYELGSLTITENGLYDILGYSRVLIDVKGGGEGGSKDPNSIGAFDGMTKINDYLYSISYSNIDYKDAIKHFESLTSENTGACSFIRMGDKIGRNFDWTINNQVEFLVKTPNTGKHYSVTGIATIEGITTDNIDEYSEDFKYLPFRLLDGINERGLVCSVNQLPQSDKTISKNGTTPTDELKETISMFMLTRYILDNFESALEAADYVKKYVKVMPILDKSGNALDFHYCIADKDSTVYLYFEGTETKYEEKSNGKFVMTNFRLAGTLLVDGHYSVTDSNIEEFGQGIERANSLIDNFDLDEVIFTKAYTTTDRLTDFAGIEGTTISNTEKLAEIQARAAAKFDQEQADGSLRTSADLWQTVHSVEYDLDELSVKIYYQEIITTKTSESFDKSILSVLKYYINKTNGNAVSNSSYKSTDYISIDSVKDIKIRSTKMTNGCLAFYDEDKTFISYTQNFDIDDLYDISEDIPTNAKFIRTCCKNTDDSEFMLMFTVEHRNSIVIKSYNVVKTGETADNYDYEKMSVLTPDSTILGLGASFMVGSLTSSNRWLNYCGNKLGVNIVNNALAGSNICLHANRLFNKTILGTGTAPISAVDAVIIMHAHNKDIFTLPEEYESYTAEDYETNGIVPFAETSGSSQDDVVYAMAFDYVIKKIKTIFFNYKTDKEYVSSVQKYMGQYIPKPCQIILATHWHDSRTIYNNSVRKLAKKWCLPLIRFDDKIGFSKDVLNFNTGKQASIEFTGNVNGQSPLETINGVVYGWHQMTGDDSYIQRKMAAIASRYFEVI